MIVPAEAMVPSASYGFATAAANLELKPGDRIVAMNGISGDALRMAHEGSTAPVLRITLRREDEGEDDRQRSRSDAAATPKETTNQQPWMFRWKQFIQSL